MSSRAFQFNRGEVAGSLGDLGVMLPLSIGLIQVNGLDATAVFLTVGLFYIASGFYFRIPVPVQPMKVIAAYAIATAVSPLEISTAGLILGAILLVLGLGGVIDVAGKLIPKPAIRGVQLTTGVLLLSEGVRFMLGESALQLARGAAEPYLSVAALGPIPIGIVLGVASVLAVLLLADNRVAPASLVVVVSGALVGLLLGGFGGLASVRPGLHFPALIPYGLPQSGDLVFVMLALVLPQLPMTFGNAIVAEADLSHEYLGEGASRVGFRSLAVSMGLANVVTAVLGGMPLCHGAGGLAAHYRFGSRTAGSNLVIGGLFLVFAVFLGGRAELLLGLLPFAVLGALLVFAGVQLALTIKDVRERTDLFVVITVLGLALVTNLGTGFVVGVGLAWGVRRFGLRI